MSINKVMATGNLTRDTELRATPAGTQVLRFGEWEDRPNFVDCVIFGARAEAMDRILAKGMKVAVEGRLRYSSWQDKEGNRRSKLEVVVDDIDLMSARAAAQQPAQGASRAYAASAPQGRPQPARAAQTPPAADIYDEDIPF